MLSTGTIISIYSSLFKRCLPGPQSIGSKRFETLVLKNEFLKKKKNSYKQNLLYSVLFSTTSQIFTLHSVSNTYEHIVLYYYRKFKQLLHEMRATL